MSRVITKGPGDLGSIPGRVIPKTQKLVLDFALFNTQHYRVKIRDKMEQSRERDSALPYTSVSYILKREPSNHPRLRSPTFTIVSKVKLATIVEGNPKAPFSIATTPRCRGGRYSFPWIAQLYP